MAQTLKHLKSDSERDPIYFKIAELSYCQVSICISIFRRKGVTWVSEYRNQIIFCKCLRSGDVCVYFPMVIVPFPMDVVSYNNAHHGVKLPTLSLHYSAYSALACM